MSTNILKCFQNDSFGKVRVVIINEKPWFIGKDIAEILAYKRPTKAIQDRVDNEDKDEVPIQDSIGRLQNTPVINESGLYSLILSSKLPKAKEFKRWITSEVLPTIRKTGGYISNEDMFINTYLPYADDNTKNLFRLQLQTIQQLNNKITEDKPLVDFANHIQASDDCIDMKAMAKLAAKNGVKIGRNRLFEFLRENKVLDKNNMPYQKYVENQPWFQVKEYTYAKGYDVGIGTITIITPKGQIGIVNMLKKHYQTST